MGIQTQGTPARNHPKTKAEEQIFSRVMAKDCIITGQHNAIVSSSYRVVPVTSSFSTAMTAVSFRSDAMPRLSSPLTTREQLLYHISVDACSVSVPGCSLYVSQSMNSSKV